jgi:hypothetical protein
MAILVHPRDKHSGSATGPAVQANPAVNLLPAETVERYRARAVVRRFVLAAGGVAVVGACLWLAQAAAINAAENDLADAESSLAQTQSQLTPLEPVKAFSAALDQQEEVVGTSMAGQTSFSRALDQFAGAWPRGSSLRTLEGTLGASCPGPDPFQTGESIGCLTWTVSVLGERQVHDLTAGLSGFRGLTSPYLTGATRNEGEFEATGTVNLDQRLLTRRFTDPTEEVAP